MADLELNRQICAEIDLLIMQKVVTPEQGLRIKERYPTGQVDLAALARWLTILGAVGAGSGLFWLGASLEAKQTLLEVGLAALSVGLIYLGRWLGRTRGQIKTQAALELVAACAAQGLTAALAVHYSTGSDNWPALLGVDTLLTLGLAYGLGNRLVLILACINALIFFGGETGYASHWEPYWFGLSYPTRFILLGCAILAVAYAHGRFLVDRWQAFSRVYLHLGLLVLHLSLWFFSVFGSSERNWDDRASERFIALVLWVAVSVTSMAAAAKLGLAALRNYGVAFLVIAIYTFYFEFVAAHSAGLWFIHLLVVGGSLVALAMNAERLKGGSGEPTPPPPTPSSPSPDGP